LALAGSQDYHYQRPHTPFVAETYQAHQQVQQSQPQTTKFTVQTLGRTYGLETQRAPVVYEDHQVVRLVQQQQVQAQQPQSFYQAPQAYQAPQTYQTPQTYQAPQQQTFNYPAPAPQPLHTSAYTNPLLVSPSYDAPPQSVPAPAPAAPPQPLSYYQQPQQIPADQRTPAPIVGYATATQPAPQPAPQYLPPAPPAPQKLFFGNPFPYAAVTVGGQQVLDAGHGSGVAPNEVQTQLVTATGQQPQAPRIGDQLGQSQSSQVDGYDYKQSSAGDTRDYQRFVTTCGPGGQCEKKQLGPGQVDDVHQRALQFTRSSSQPRVEGCYKSPVVYVPVGAVVNDQGQLRPKNRRQNERQEQIFSRYPYN
ncbi:hypothetical protein KR018_004047, partial [Drosophila ironensis]